MGADNYARRLSAKIRTAVRLHRAKRRTRQVFRRGPQMPMVAGLVLVAMVIVVVYVFVADRPSRQTPADIADETETTADQKAAITARDAPPETAADATKRTEQDQKEALLERTYPIDTSIPDNISVATLFGDESFDAMLPGVCSAPIKDAKRDIENVFAYNLKAQEEFEEARQAYLREKEKIEEAHARLVGKRQRLDAIRIGCIEEQLPFGDVYKAYSNTVKE